MVSAKFVVLSFFLTGRGGRYGYYGTGAGHTLVEV